MACHLLIAKPLYGPMLAYYQSDTKEYISIELFLQIKSFSSIKWIWKWCLPICIHFSSASYSSMNIGQSWSYFHGSLFLWNVIDVEVIIGLDNGLAPNRQQAII